MKEKEKRDMESVDKELVLRVKESMAIVRKNRELMKPVREADADFDIGLPPPPLFSLLLKTPG